MTATDGLATFGGVNRGCPRIVADGATRLRETLVPLVRAEVARRYERELQTASGWRRVWLKWKIERAVSVALQRRLPPPGALYVARSAL